MENEKSSWEHGYLVFTEDGRIIHRAVWGVYVQWPDGRVSGPHPLNGAWIWLATGKTQRSLKWVYPCATKKQLPSSRGRVLLSDRDLAFYFVGAASVVLPLILLAFG